MINVGSERIAKLLPNKLITTNGKRSSKTLYLTFDDGPHPVYTLPICELLDSYSIKATFFCIGKHLEKYPEIAQQLVDQGHLIANHSDKHFNFIAQPLAAQIAEVDACQSTIRLFDPGCPDIFRAPKGELNISLLLGLLRKNWSVIHWSYDSLDYMQDPLDKQLETFKRRKVANGDILLFHDDNQLALDLLTNLIPEWIDEGFSFETLRELGA